MEQVGKICFNPSTGGFSLSNSIDKKTLRFILIAFAMNGLLSDHMDHSDKKLDNETCAQTVARLSCKFADAVLERLDK